MNRKELGRKLRTYAMTKSRTYRDFTRQENRTDEMAERLICVPVPEMEALDELIIEHGKATGEERFTADMIALKLENKITELIDKYANKDI